MTKLIKSVIISIIVYPIILYIGLIFSMAISNDSDFSVLIYLMWIIYGFLGLKVGNNLSIKYGNVESIKSIIVVIWVVSSLIPIYMMMSFTGPNGVEGAFSFLSLLVIIFIISLVLLVVKITKISKINNG